MVEKKNQQETTGCPVGEFFRDIESVFGRKSKFFDHMNQSRIEFLKGIRSLVDERIENLEKKAKAQPRKKMTKVNVE
jgi:hypothetical protein